MWSNNCTSVIGHPVISHVDIDFLAHTDAAPLKPIPFLEIFFKIFFYFLAFLVDIIGNSIVIFIIYANKRMRTSANILIVNLAISDILVGCCCMWVHLGNQITQNWPFGAFLCKFETFVQGKFFVLDSHVFNKMSTASYLGRNNQLPIIINVAIFKSQCLQCFPPWAL